MPLGSGGKLSQCLVARLVPLVGPNQSLKPQLSWVSILNPQGSQSEGRTRPEPGGWMRSFITHTSKWILHFYRHSCFRLLHPETGAKLRLTDLRPPQACQDRSHSAGRDCGRIKSIGSIGLDSIPLSGMRLRMAPAFCPSLRP